MIGVRFYAAALPGGTAALVATPAQQADLAHVGRLAAAHPAPIRIDVLAAPGTRVDADTARTLVQRTACVATAGTAAPTRSGMVGPQGRWYATLVVWGWLLLLAAGQSLGQVLGGLWLAIGLPWTRLAYRRAGGARRGPIAEWLGAALAGAEVRVHDHAGLATLAEQAHGEQPAQSDEVLRRLAAACAAAGVPELRPFYGALAAGQLPAGMWCELPPAPVALEATPPTAAGAERADAAGSEQAEAAASGGDAEPIREAQAA